MEQRYLDYARWLIHRGEDPEAAALRAAEALLRQEVVWNTEELESSWALEALTYHKEEILRLLSEDLEA